MSLSHNNDIILLHDSLITCIVQSFEYINVFAVIGLCCCDWTTQEHCGRARINRDKESFPKVSTSSFFSCPFNTLELGKEQYSVTVCSRSRWICGDWSVSSPYLLQLIKGEEFSWRKLDWIELLCSFWLAWNYQLDWSGFKICFVKIECIRSMVSESLEQEVCGE